MKDEEDPSFTVLHIPHSSRVIPDDLRDGIFLSNDELENELLRLTDAYTDEIFNVDTHSNIAQKVVFSVSRLVVDPERFLNDDFEPMSEFGMGAVYTQTTDGRTLRSFDSNYRDELIESYYNPHHETLTRAVDEAVIRQGFCFILDCHSFPSKPLLCELDQSPDRPDICIGTDDFHTPAEIAEMAVRLFKAAGYSVELNKPFSGALVPLEYFGNDKRVMALMIELNRSLYMDEAKGEKGDNFNEFAQGIRRIVLELIEDVKQYWTITLERG